VRGFDYQWLASLRVGFPRSRRHQSAARPAFPRALKLIARSSEFLIKGEFATLIQGV
jgi:hypothetical protein